MLASAWFPPHFLWQMSIPTPLFKFIMILWYLHCSLSCSYSHSYKFSHVVYEQHSPLVHFQQHHYHYYHHFQLQENVLNNWLLVHLSLVSITYVYIHVSVYKYCSFTYHQLWHDVKKSFSVVPCIGLSYNQLKAISLLSKWQNIIV